jgi:hypothetical protein
MNPFDPEVLSNSFIDSGKGMARTQFSSPVVIPILRLELQHSAQIIQWAFVNSTL